MSSDELDTTPYLRPPRVDVAQGVALAISLLAAVPKAAPPSVKKHAKALRKATVDLQERWSERKRADAKGPAPATKLAADNRIDTAWGALKMRLDAVALLPIARTPSAIDAAKLVAALFPEGLAFLAIRMEKEWAQSEELLRRIDADGLAGTIDRLAGPDFLAEVRDAHAAYGVALGITKPLEGADETTTILATPLREMVSAMRKYALQLVASLDADEPLPVGTVRAALAPFDRVREAATKPAQTTPETPVPDVPK